ncbi:hypothetical protein PanNE5_13020 [Pandoraea sp. NE5]|nr:hypothetical protein PanNE5_13020 [Pandoraea sp. NE5]
MQPERVRSGGLAKLGGREWCVGRKVAFLTSSAIPIDDAGNVDEMDAVDKKPN